MKINAKIGLEKVLKRAGDGYLNFYVVSKRINWEYAMNKDLKADYTFKVMEVNAAETDLDFLIMVFEDKAENENLSIWQLYNEFVGG